MSGLEHIRLTQSNFRPIFRFAQRCLALVWGHSSAVFWHMNKHLLACIILKPSYRTPSEILLKRKLLRMRALNNGYPMNEMLPSESSYPEKTKNQRTRLDTNLVISTERLMLMSTLFTQVLKSREKSNQRNINLQLWINKTLFIISSVVCAMQTMLASRVDTYINVWTGTQAINTRPTWGWAWKGSRHHHKQFQNPEKVSEQTRLLDFWNAFYSWPNTKTEQTIRLDPCEVICLIISLF